MLHIYINPHTTTRISYHQTPDRWKNLLLLLNPAAFMPLTYSRYDLGTTPLESDGADATRDHWVSALFERARVSRVQVCGGGSGRCGHELLLLRAL
jgi:hypothetical protein